MHTPRFRALRGRANVAVALLVVSAVISVLSVLFELEMRSLLQQSAAGQPIGLAKAQAVDDRAALAAILSLVALVATGIAFIAWFFRAYANLECLGVLELRARKGWSIGAWFVPFLNLVRPKQLMNDVWRASDPALPAGEVRGWRQAPVPGLLHGWWALFLLGSIASNFAGRALAGADTVSERVSAGEISMLSDVTMTVAAVLAVLVVRAVTSRQEGRAARLAAGGPPTPDVIAYAVAPHADAARPGSVPPPTAA